MSPYVVAWIYPNMKVPSPVSTKGGVNPTWNSVLRLVCEESLLQQGGANLTVEILNHGSFSNKAIGTVSIPLSRLSSKEGQGSSSAGSSSYQIRRPSGKFQGVLNVSVKLGEVVKAATAASWVAPNMATSSDTRSNGNTPMTAYPAAAGYPMGAGQYPQQNQQFYQPAPYYQQGYAQQAPAKTRRSGLGFGRAGLGTGLLGGALGGMLLGSAMDGGDGGGDGGGCGGGGGGCGGGGCGG